MFFFCTCAQYNKKPSCSLQVQIQSFAPTNEVFKSVYKIIKLSDKFSKYKKRTAQFTSKENSASKASMTIESALVMPIFIYAIISIVYFVQIFTLHEIISEGIVETGKYASRHTYVYQHLLNDSHSQEEELNYFKKVIDATLLKQKLKEYVNAHIIDNSCILGGYNGISLYYSSYLKEDDLIEIAASYKIQLPILFFNIKDINIMQRIKLKAWTGYNGNIQNDYNTWEEIVYITETGTVYHITKECTHLKLSIKQESYNNISNLRNQSGGKYKPCEICSFSKELTQNSIIYITDTGDRYHATISCSGLKRILIEIPLWQINGKSPCKRCTK